MANDVIEFFRQLLNNDILTIFIISMLPIIELRGAIPVAIEMGFSWFEAFGYAFLGSIIVAPILLLILMPILKAMKKIKGFRGIANAVEGLFQSKAESVRKKANKADSRGTEDMIKMLGVFLFVAIPLPLTGVWTGTAVAVFLGLGFWKSLAAVAVGNISSGLIMTGLSLLFKENLDLFLTIFMALVLGVLVINIIYLVVKNHLKKKKSQNLGNNGDSVSDNVVCNIENKSDNEYIQNVSGDTSTNIEDSPSSEDCAKAEKENQQDVKVSANGNNTIKSNDCDKDKEEQEKIIDSVKCKCVVERDKTNNILYTSNIKD